MNMIERVAAAIHDNRYGAPKWGERGNDDYDKAVKAAAMSEARAAIEATRVPTRAMHDAARDWSDRKYGKPIGSDASGGCYRAMIDAALAGHQGDEAK